MAFAMHARPLNRLRKAHGLPGLGDDLRRTYTDADRTLYADVPELVPTRGLPPNHRYLGPVEWSPTIEPPSWWGEIPGRSPGDLRDAGQLGPSRLARERPGGLAGPAGDGDRGLGREGDRRAGSPPNARVAPYLPGREAAARSSLVICNGGSPTTHQALGGGTPVLGLAENLDQHLNMRAIVDRGAGLLVRSEHARPAAIRAAVERLLAEPSFRRPPADLAETFARYDAQARFRAVLDEVIAFGDLSEPPRSVDPASGRSSTSSARGFVADEALGPVAGGEGLRGTPGERRVPRLRRARGRPGGSRPCRRGSPGGRSAHRARFRAGRPARGAVVSLADVDEPGQSRAVPRSSG